MAQPVKNILIVGGGTAGWMAATYLAPQLSAIGGRVTLVEAPAIPTIGVGEATVPPLVGYLRVLGISEDEFMRKSHATYKLGIKFINWHDGGRAGEDSYWHPFGPVGGNIDGMPLFHFWLKNRRASNAEGAYTSYSLQALLGEQEKAPRAVSASTPLYDRGQYAYHLYAGAFAEFLKGEALKRGAVHLADEVTEVVVGERGHIHSVVTKRNGALRADLYIDCSGFRALLAEQALGDPYIDWSDSLMCDRALAAPLPLGPRTPPYTRSSALSAGWAWQIPLTQRVGNGYVYSSKFLGEEAAGHELAGLLGVKLETLQPRLLKMKVGRRTHCWLGNCIAIGLASGFVEPLESTGIFAIQRSLALLLTYFPDLDFQPHLARRYNQRMAATYDEIRDFILAHYVLTRRDDTPFWNAYRGLALPDSLRELLEAYDRTGLVEPVEHAVFPAPSWYAILAGQRRLPSGAHAGAELSSFAQVRGILEAIRAQNARLAQTLPGHRDYIEMLNRGDPGRRVLETAKMTDSAATGGIG
jgi:tryptophan 7-halogenase